MSSIDRSLGQGLKPLDLIPAKKESNTGLELTKQVERLLADLHEAKSWMASLEKSSSGELLQSIKSKLTHRVSTQSAESLQGPAQKTKRLDPEWKSKIESMIQGVLNDLEQSKTTHNKKAWTKKIETAIQTVLDDLGQLKASQKVKPLSMRKVHFEHKDSAQ